MTEEMYCPNCSTPINIIAEGSVSQGKSPRLIDRQMESNEMLKLSLESKGGYWEKNLDVYYGACVKCERLYLIWHSYGTYIEILGTLTKEGIAIFIGAKLKE